MPRRKKATHLLYAIDAAFDGNPTTLQESLHRLRDKIKRTTSIAVEQDSESNNAYNDFLSGFGSVNAGFGIDGTATTYYENDNLEAGFYSDFLQGFGGNADPSGIPQQNLQYMSHFVSGFSGNANPNTVAPNAAEALDAFEDGIE